ncbi:MAG: NAD-dependent epimerase/dehydratase family protein [Cyanobacteriota bacterium]|nr:NAD-dependent epimerase/dehydratase family protein [Cyanobacteriota bacterium]
MTDVVTVFGGGGFLGSSIVDRLLTEGHAVRILERPRIQPHRTFLPGERVEWLQGDFGHLPDVRAALEGATAVVHLPWTTRPKSSNDEPIYDVQSNVISSLQLLDEMRGIGIKKILFASSGGTVYGPTIRTPIQEDHPTNPTTSYGITKLTVEKYLLLARDLHGLRPMILRIANPYGERQRVEYAQGVVAAFLQRALTGQPIEIWGDGSVIRDFLYVADVTKAIAAALAYQGDACIFNIGSGAGISLNSLVQILSEVLGRDLEVIHQPARSFDVKSNVLCCQRAQEELGWRADTSMAEGLRRTVAWLREQQA